MDLAQLLGGGGQDPTGLLTPQQSGDINQATLQSIAAGLMKASGPSPYKPGMTAMSGIGEAFQGGLAARREAQKDALTQTLVRSKTLEGVAPLLKLQQEYATAGIPLPENYQRVLDAVIGLTTGGRPSPGAPSAPGATGAVAAGPVVTPRDNIIQQTADKLGISRYDLLSSSGGHETAMKRIDAEIAANQPSIEAAKFREKTMDADIAHTAKAYPAFAALGQIGDTAKREAELSQAIANSPGFYSGLGSDWDLLKKKFAAYLDPSDIAAGPMQVFRKILAANVNNQIEQAAVIKGEIGAAGGRTFQSQIDLYKQASQSLDNTPAANKFLADLQVRFADQNIKISDMAIDYKIKNKVLDAGFDKELSKYLRENPLYTPQELRNIHKIMKGEPAVDQPGAPSGVAPGSSGLPATTGFAGSAASGAANMLPNQGMGPTTAIPGGPSADFLSPQTGQLELPGTSPPIGVNPAPVPGRPAPGQQPMQTAQPPVVSKQVTGADGKKTTIYQTKVNGVWVPSTREGVPLKPAGPNG